MNLKKLNLYNNDLRSQVFLCINQSDLLSIWLLPINFT